MNVVFLMGNKKSADDCDSSYPIYMTEINEEIILEKQISHCKKINPDKMIFCIQKEDIKNFNVDRMIEQSLEQFICITIYGQTSGSVCTALLAAEHIDKNEELILVSIDEMIDKNPVDILNFFRNKNCDAGVVSFRSVHPRYSFVRIGADECACEVDEKNPISKNALASFYYFKNGCDFVDCAKNVIRKDNRTKGSFYVSQTMNEMILRQKNVGVYSIPRSDFHPLKTEIQMAQYMMKLKEHREDCY